MHCGFAGEVSITGSEDPQREKNEGSIAYKPQVTAQGLWSAGRRVQAGEGEGTYIPEEGVYWELKHCSRKKGKQNRPFL